MIRDEFLRSKLTSPEKAQITDRVSGWARGRGAARFLLSNQLRQGLDSVPPVLRRRLEVAVSQILYEERTPKPILVSATVEEIKRQHGDHLGNLANAVLRGISRFSRSELPWPDRVTDLAGHLAEASSHPRWIVQRWLNRGGEERTQEQLEWDNQRPHIWLRWNLLRGGREEAVRRLGAAHIEFEELAEFPHYYRLKSAFYPDAVAEVETGFFSVQDPSASLAVRLMNPAPGMKILDLCAAPGGKTTLAAELCGNRCQITAVDVSADRLKRLEESVSRLGIENVRIVRDDVLTLDKTDNHLGQFDAVLLDVPCSGFGVLARRADLRWRRKPEDLPELIALQGRMIRAAAQFVRLGGILIYSTCSIEPEENEAIVRQFLNESEEFCLESFHSDVPGRLFTSPAEVNTISPRDRVDGVYAARIVRKR